MLTHVKRLECVLQMNGIYVYFLFHVERCQHFLTEMEKWIATIRVSVSGQCDGDARMAVCQVIKNYWGNGVTDLENRSLLVLGSEKHESRPSLKVGA